MLWHQPPRIGRRGSGGSHGGIGRIAARVRRLDEELGVRVAGRASLQPLVQHLQYGRRSDAQQLHQHVASMLASQRHVLHVYQAQQRAATRPTRSHGAAHAVQSLERCHGGLQIEPHALQRESRRRCHQELALELRYHLLVVVERVAQPFTHGVSHDAAAGASLSQREPPHKGVVVAHGREPVDQL